MSNLKNAKLNAGAPEQEQILLVVMHIESQRFGVPVTFVRDVLKDQKIAPIPKAPAEIAGSINLRGRIVTVIDVRKRLKLQSVYGEQPVFVVIDRSGEYFCLLVDKVEDVIDVETCKIEACPSNLNRDWQDIAQGVLQCEQDIIIILNIENFLRF